MERRETERRERERRERESGVMDSEVHDAAHRSGITPGHSSAGTEALLYDALRELRSEAQMVIGRRMDALLPLNIMHVSRRRGGRDRAFAFGIGRL